MPYCTRCGQLLKEGANFCSSCGAQQPNSKNVPTNTNTGGFFSKLFSSVNGPRQASASGISQFERLIIEADKKTPGAQERLWSEMERRHIDEDYDRIRRALYSRLAQQGDPFAEVQLAEIAVTENRPQDAYSLFYSAAQKNSAAAMAGIGNLYNETFNEMYKGLGYSPEKTFYWYMEAAKRNDPDGIYQIAQYYRDGVSVPASLENAKSWAERGDQLSIPKCTRFLADSIYGNPTSPYHDDRKEIEYLERTMRMGSESEYAFTALSLGRKFGGYYLYGGNPANYTNPKKAAYCLVLAFIADDLSSWDEIGRIPYNISEGEFNTWKDDAINLRYRA